MAVDQLPAEVRLFAGYLDGLVARLDPGAGWCGVFWRRDPEGMRACLDGYEVPPWDVVEALLRDLGAAYGPAAAAAEGERARTLHAAALAAHDARPGAGDVLADRLDVMLREQRYAAERRAGLEHRLSAPASPEEVESLRTDLAWVQDDHERATARCAELRARLAGLRHAATPEPRAAPAGRHPRAAPAQQTAPAREPGRRYRAGPVDEVSHPHGTDPAGHVLPGNGVSGDPGVAPDGGFPRSVPGRRAAAAGEPGGAYRAGPVDEVSHPHGTDPAGQVPSGRGASPTVPSDRVGTPAGPAVPAAVAAPGGSGSRTSPAPTAEAAPAPAKPRKRRRGSARFAGMAEDGAAPVAVPEASGTVAAEEDAGGSRTPRGARFAGAAPAAEAAPAPVAADAGAGAAVDGAVARLARLRAEGRSGEAHVLLVEATGWPAARLPLLADALHRAGLGADWATLLWEAAALPAERLVAAADALAAAGRDTDGRQMLRQGVARPAEQIGAAVLRLDGEGRRREVRVLLDAYVRVRAPEEAARSAAADPGRLVPLLLEAAHTVSDERHWDLVHALRVAGHTP
ncbi:hypothetical protein GCM10010503_66110 [Streptomyces lucensis JCM 4490]|uniref:UL36 very large tegument protein n=1 Tax=Streptomyces lucensis JCM 4490 TaxID=1306176 RepID=A0A918JG57_9ACTN|nr:hypothetical protein [Streptomyces lucensis]GGW79304.1 hypothetical protein GCM10010503_66110 [Streptomyces lucensis JCM 4490]